MERFIKHYLQISSMGEQMTTRKAGMMPAVRTIEDFLSVGISIHSTIETELLTVLSRLEDKLAHKVSLELTISGKTIEYGDVCESHSRLQLIEGAYLTFENDPLLLSLKSKEYLREIAPYLALAVRSVMVAESQRNLAGLALTDGLTGLHNRRALDRLIGDELAELREQERRDSKRQNDSTHGLSVMMLDVDNFKSYNDRHGHGGGDETLRTLAQYLRHGRRKHDGVFRYGGEEFAIVLPDCPLDASIRRANEVCAYVAEQSINDSKQGKLPESFIISIGIANTSELPAETRYEGTKSSFGGIDYSIVAFADERLYVAKKNGRNRVCSSSAPVQ